MPGGIYDYDALGRMLMASDPDGVITTYVWAATGELISVSSPADFGTRTFEYDDDGHLTDQYDSAGHHVHYQRDSLGRLVNRYDADALVEQYVWDTRIPGKLSRVTDAAGTINYMYDSSARLKSESRTFPDGTTATHSLTWDDQDRVKVETMPDGVAIANTYARGRLIRREVTLTDGRVISFTPVYDSRGRFTGFPVDGWKLGLRLDLDLVGRVTGMHWDLFQKLTSPPRAVNHTYTYQDNGLIRNRRLLNAPTPSTYAYDPAGRLRSAVGRGAADWILTDGGFPELRTGLDARTFLPQAGPNTHRMAVVAAPDNRLDMKWVYTYDAAGNVTKIDQMEKIRVTETVFIGYDGLGRPITASSARGTMSRRFAHDGSVAMEVVEGTTIKRLSAWENVAGKNRTNLSLLGVPIGRVQNGAELIATMADLHGTPTTEVNEKDRVTSTLELDPYGVVITATKTPDVAHGWLGLPRDGKLGLVSTGARLYDERSRTFLSPEPKLFGATAVNLALDPYMSNPYAYSRWNGVSLLDPDGRAPESVALVVLVDQTYAGSIRQINGQVGYARATWAREGVDLQVERTGRNAQGSNVRTHGMTVADPQGSQCRFHRP